VQLSVPAEMRGRVMGIYMLVFLGGAPLGSPLTGWVAELFGTRMSMIAGASISVAATVIVAALVARRRGVPVRAYLRQAAFARLAA
jgi:MFS family permease